jgi:hypothetical protein
LAAAATAAACLLAVPRRLDAESLALEREAGHLEEIGFVLDDEDDLRGVGLPGFGLRQVVRLPA